MMNELISLISVSRDYINTHEQTTETKRIVYAEVKSPTRSEFYQSYKAGLKASLVFQVYTDELGDAEFVLYCNKRYKIIRTYMTDVNYTEITCSEVV